MLFRGVFLASGTAGFTSTITEVRMFFTASHTVFVISTLYDLLPASSCVKKCTDAFAERPKVSFVTAMSSYQLLRIGLGHSSMHKNVLTS